MSLPSSSTSSSEGVPGRHRSSPTLRGCVATLFWTLVFLAFADMAINAFFAIPSDPTQEPRPLQRFFDYGRSIEGKLRLMIGPDDASSHPLLRAGWIDQIVGSAGEDGWDVARKGQRLRIACYGMSFAFSICREMASFDNTVVLRLLGGPAAPLSHLHALYMRDRGGRDADVVVLGILASSLPALYSAAYMTWNFEAPGAYTYPRYWLVGGRLERASSPVSSLEGLRAALLDPARWRAFRNDLRRLEEGFIPPVFDATVLDHSAIVRIVRRSLAHRSKRAAIDRFHDKHGFRAESGIVELAAALAIDFARAVQEDGATPLILLLNDQGYGDDLFRALAPALDDASIAYVSTHEIAPATDPVNFIGDGHFTKLRDRAIAEQLLATIRLARSRSDSRSQLREPTVSTRWDSAR